MKKTSLLKSMLLLCALVAGSGSVWADKTAGFSLTASAGSYSTGTITGTTALSESWSYVATFTEAEYYGSANQAWQVGKAAKSGVTYACESLVLSTSGIPGTIKQINVSCGTQAGKGSVNCTVGGKAFGTQGQSAGSGNNPNDWTSTPSFTGTASGEIVITINNTGTYIMLKSVTVTYDDTKYAITPGYAKTTYVAPDKLDFASVTPSGLTAYVATDAAAAGVTMSSVDAVPANTPLVLIGTASTTYYIPVAAGSPAAPATNKLVKGDGTTVFNGSTYDYALGSDGKFHLLNSGTMATTKAYLHLDSAPASHSLDLIFNDGDVTAINVVDVKKEENNVFYNLNGQRVSANHKGLVIVNGKKYMNK